MSEFPTKFETGLNESLERMKLLYATRGLDLVIAGYSPETIEALHEPVEGELPLADDDETSRPGSFMTAKRADNAQLRAAPLIHEDIDGKTITPAENQSTPKMRA